MVNTFLVTGIGRSGTSALGRLLNMCSGVLCVHEQGQRVHNACCHPKDRQRIIFPERLSDAIENIGFEQYPHKRKEVIIRHGVKIPHPDAFHDIFLHAPMLKVIAIVRHPIDTCISQFSCEMGDTNPGWPGHVSGHNQGLYKMHMHYNFMNFIDNLKRVSVVKFEELFTDPGTVQYVFKSLGIRLSKGICKEYLAQSAKKGKPPVGNVDPEYGHIDNPLRKRYSELYAEYQKRFPEMMKDFLTTFNYKV